MNKNNQPLSQYISPLGIWALSFGCSVGWGSFVMPGTTFLPIAGPVGTVLGMTIGAIMMLIIGRNYYYLMNRYPDAGGTYTYSKKLFGYDHGFLSGWFLILTYVAILWANLTALVLIARNLLGDFFQFGFHYQLAGYDIYFGEILISVGLLLLCCFICIFRKRLAMWVQILMALVLIGGIVVCFAVAAANGGRGSVAFDPAFSGGSGDFTKVLHIVALTPWAYVGFETVSHSAEELRYKKNRTFIIVVIAVFTAGLAYSLLSMLAVTALPDGYSDWPSYIAALGDLSGREALPTFFAVGKTMGDVGVTILGVAVIGGIVTGIIGNMIASSRVLYAIAKDDILPGWFKNTNREGNPVNAILFITAISVIIPFFGRTAISWIVDVTTVGATIIYAYTSAAALREARRNHNRAIVVTGVAGLIFAVLFALYFLIPNLSSVSTLSTESYLILTIWSILGLLFFRKVFGSDLKHRFGKSIIVWIFLIILIMFTSIIWMQQANNSAIADARESISGMYAQELTESGAVLTAEDTAHIDGHIEEEMSSLNSSLIQNNIVRFIMISTAVLILFSVYTLMTRRQREFERIEDMAFKDSLTGVGNKHAYENQVKSINKRIADGTEEGFAVVVCDLNNLKTVNDTQGHAAGDAYIRKACKSICDTFVHSPVFRTGGDEFVVLLMERDYEDRDALLKELCKKSSMCKGSGSAMIALGMSVYEKDADDSVAPVFARADVTMYENKRELKTMHKGDNKAIVR